MREKIEEINKKFNKRKHREEVNFIEILKFKKNLNFFQKYNKIVLFSLIMNKIERKTIEEISKTIKQNKKKKEFVRNSQYFLNNFSLKISFL